MKYHREYEISNDFFKDNTINWKVTGNGQFIIGSKGGEKYFIKRNIHIRYPSKSLDSETYKKRLLESKFIQEKQEILKTHMRDLPSDSHILDEKNHFWDNDNMFVTVTNYIEDTLPNGFDYSILSQKEFLNLASKAAKLIKDIHSCNVIHGDIKEANVLVKKIGEEYIPYLIDFDTAYIYDEKWIPSYDTIGGTEKYLSPEVVEYAFKEDETLQENISPKIDVFSLGILYHRWWTNAFPGISIEDCSVGEAVLQDPSSITIDNKFNFIIGEENGASFKSLIYWMLQDKDHRPSIDDVLNVLADKQIVNMAYQIGNDERPFDDLWIYHQEYAQLSEDTLKAKSIKKLKKVNDGTGSSGYKYRIIYNDGKEEMLSIKDLIIKNYAFIKEIIVDEPWEEHKIKFVSTNELYEKGYSKLQRVIQGYKYRYLLTDFNGRTRDIGCDSLLRAGLAEYIRYEVNVDVPWPEHGSSFIEEKLQLHNVKSITRIELAKEHRYKIVYRKSKDGESKVLDNVSINSLRLMGFIK